MRRVTFVLNREVKRKKKTVDRVHLELDLDYEPNPNDLKNPLLHK